MCIDGELYVSAPQQVSPAEFTNPVPREVFDLRVRGRRLHLATYNCRGKHKVDDTESFPGSDAVVDANEVVDTDLKPGLFLRLTYRSLHQGLSDLRLARREIEPRMG